MEPSHCFPFNLIKAADRMLEREASVFAAELLKPESALGTSWRTSQPVQPTSTSPRPPCIGGRVASGSLRTRHAIFGDTGRTRLRLIATFAHEHTEVPILAFVLTRLVPLIAVSVSLAESRRS
jgi:hypothetical protein